MNVDELQRQIEQKFAPGPLLAVQALVNTQDFERDEELLSDPETTREWLLRSGLVTEVAEVGATEHERLREFRRVVRSMLEANLHPDEAAVETEALAGFVAGLGVPLRVGPEAAIELDAAPAESVDGLVAQMLGAIFAAQIRGEWERLKICAADDCRWAFYDSSKNRGGQWCRMDLCGNRVKNRRYRAAHATD